jgi:hypothetical protein
MLKSENAGRDGAANRISGRARVDASRISAASRWGARQRAAPSPAEDRRLQLPGELSASKSKKTKANERKIAFISFHKFFGIGTFQRVMRQKNKKIWIRLNSRLGLCLSRSTPRFKPPCFSPLRWSAQFRQWDNLWHKVLLLPSECRKISVKSNHS